MLAVLKKDIKFFNFDNEWITLKEGTDIYVDREESVGYAQGMHFDIQISEYSVIN